MRDFSSCFSDRSWLNRHDRNSINHSPIQATVTNSYLSLLSSLGEVPIELTWSRTRTSPALVVSFDDKSTATSCTKGSDSFTSGDSVVGLSWDLSAARYESSPEPVSGFYVVVIVDEELALRIGDKSGEFVDRFRRDMNVAEFRPRSRTVKTVGQTTYSTRARFRAGGGEHGIVVRLKREKEMSVCVDEKMVVRVTNTRWNFRGNETLFVDGLVVDLMWDLYGWLSTPQGSASFVFRTRVLAVKPWLEEKETISEPYSLLISLTSLSL